VRREPVVNRRPCVREACGELAADVRERAAEPGAN